MSDAVRVRIAPSPTGPFHIGTARTALFNLLFARRHGGTYIVRVEDTDTARSTKEFEADILAGLAWLGLAADEGVVAEGERGDRGPYRQSERSERYTAVANELRAKGLTYPCFCTPGDLDAERKAREAAKLPPRYSGRCAAIPAETSAARIAAGESAALRFRIKPGVVVIEDLVRGRVEIDSDALGGDLVILRADGTPLYHFTVVVDDADMGITHVIRGEDHLSNTPKHILLFEALGVPLPKFAHLPLILNPDRTKMSKRKSQTALGDYRAEGFLVEALINFQTAICDLTGMEIANASLLDEGTAAAEAVTLAHAVGSVADGNLLLIDVDTHPQTIDVLKTRTEPLGIALLIAPVTELLARAANGEPQTGDFGREREIRLFSGELGRPQIGLGSLGLGSLAAPEIEFPGGLHAGGADVGATRDTNAERHATGLKRDAGRFKAGTNGNGGLIAGIGRGK